MRYKTEDLYPEFDNVLREEVAFAQDVRIAARIRNSYLKILDDAFRNRIDENGEVDFKTARDMTDSLTSHIKNFHCALQSQELNLDRLNLLLRRSIIKLDYSYVTLEIEDSEAG